MMIVNDALNNTASSGLNSVSAVLLEDVVKKIKPDITDAYATRLSKIIACTLGITVIALSFLVSMFGSMVLQLAYSIFGIIGGPYLGLFCLGMLVPWSTWKGAYCGVFVGVCSTLWMAIGGLIYPPNRNAAMVDVRQCEDFINYKALNVSQLANYTKPVPVIFLGNGTYYPAQHYVAPDINEFLTSWYAMSYLWYAAIGVSYTFVTGCLFSIFWKVVLKEEDELVDKELLFDYKGFFQSLVPSRFQSEKYNINKDDEEVQMSNMSNLNTISTEPLSNYS